MSEMSKKARAAMRNKAKSLSATKEQKVDSSDWSPAEPLNADVKTGMRPVSRRAYKKGGKVMGAKPMPRADRMPRKKGGKVESEKAEAKEYANAKVNRNVKEANEEREGIKHVGGMKKGGRAKKQEGGSMATLLRIPKDIDPRDTASLKAPKDYGDMVDKNQLIMAPDWGERPNDWVRPKVKKLPLGGMKKGGRAGKNNGGGSRMDSGSGYNDLAYELSVKQSQMKQDDPSYNKGQGPTKQNAANLEYSQELENKKKNRAGKNNGGKSGFSTQKDASEAVSEEDAKRMREEMERQRQRAQEEGAGVRKSGGRAKRERGGRTFYGPQDNEEGKPGVGLSEQKAIGKRQQDDSKPSRGKAEQYKKGGRTEKAVGGPMPDDMVDPRAAAQGMMLKAAQRSNVPANRMGFSRLGKGMLSPLRAVKDGGSIKRMNRKSGGRTKGKTNINIVIAAGKPQGMDQMIPPGNTPPMPMAGPGGIPVPLPAAGGAPGGAAAPAPMPMPIPMPMPMPAAGGAGGMPPMPRKSGGRAMSYKDMTAGAGSGEGRIQKTEIAEHKRGMRKAGGRTYRSYKDMDAGAGSGLGRLEKTEIQAHKK